MSSLLRTAGSRSWIVLFPVLAACGGDGGTGPNGGGGPVATSITIGGTDVTLVSIGETVVITATATDASGNAITSGFTWTSTNTSAATVSGTTNSATVTAVGNGATTIRVARNAVSDEVMVTVAQELVGIEVSPSPATVLEGLSEQLTGTPQDARGNAISGLTVMWSSDDPGVASVDQTGLVTGVSVGQTTIRASTGGFEASSDVDVEQLSFAAHVETILDASCALGGCHSASDPQEGMNLTAGAAYGSIVNVQSNQSSLLRIDPGEPDDSYLVHKIQGTQNTVGGSGDRMPQGGPFLSTNQINIIRAWVSADAPNN